MDQGCNGLLNQRKGSNLDYRTKTEYSKLSRKDLFQSARPMPKTPSPIRILLMADSHLGFDLPVNPRVERRRRGHDFLANHRRALAAAVEGEVDLVVHGGDVFHRSRVHRSLVYQAFKPMVEVAETGIPIFVVPGNQSGRGTRPASGGVRIPLRAAGSSRGFP